MQPSKVYADIANDVSYDDESSSFGSHLPPDAESLLQEEMLKLSLKDRNSTQEEIHGVHCLSPEESPAFLEASLRKLDLELNGNNIPIDQKKAYLKSQELFASQNKPTYVNSEEFRLRFLRCELFDVPTAALRIAKYLTLVLELFGEFALQRPIRMRDFSKIELREFRKGRYQFLPYRDRAGTRGRRILSVYPDEEWEKISTGLRTKIWLYLTYVAGDDIETQKNGIVMLAWFDTAWKHLSKRPVYSPQSSRVLSLCVRTTSVHICTPDTPLYRFRRSIMVMRLGKERSRVKIHVGKSVELMYTLQNFGIPVDYIPISFTGKVKEKYIKEWIRLRQLIEEERLHHSWTAQSKSNMIECPYLDDIIFRNGTSLLSHPGNIALRSMIAAKSMHEDNKYKNTKTIVLAVIAEIKAKRNESQTEDGKSSESGCRFLIWNEKGWWKQVQPENEQKAIQGKISRIVRETRKLVTANQKKQEVAELTSVSKSQKILPITDRRGGGTYMFLQSERGTSQKRQRLSVDEDCFGIGICDVEWICGNYS